MNRFKWRDQYDETDERIAGIESLVHNDEPSLTQQQFKADADLNTLVKRFGIGDGAIPIAAPDPAYYGDFSDALDYRQSLDAIRDAEEKFNALPAQLRTRFQNDPVQLWDFVNDPDNAQEAVSLGLLKQNTPPPKADPDPAPITP